MSAPRAARGSVARRRQVVRAGDLVDELIGKRSIAGAVREHRLVTGWKEIVGERVAARTWPDGLKNGVLQVRVANSSWLHELSFMREMMIDAANRHVGPPSLVRDLRLHLGARRDIDQADEEDIVAQLARRRRAPAPRPRLATTDPRTLAAISADTTRVTDDELRELVRRVRQRLGL